MIKIAKRQYHVQPGETITIGVQATGTAHLVNYDLDGQGGGPVGAGQPLTFTVTTSTRILTLLFTFSGNSGGKYVVGITSAQGGSDTDVVDQGSFGIPTTAAEYRFQL
jgi:hypothetical protein